MSITAKKFEQNKLNGILAEIIAIQDFLSNGYEIKRTGIGSDFIAYKKIPGGIDQTYVEVKYGNASLSSLQKKQRFLAKKHNMGFFEYRVTEEFLGNFKIKHNIKTENMNPDQLRESIYQTGITENSSKFRMQLPWICPNCNQTKANSQAELIENFGMRKMGNGVIRNQSWCRRCR